MHWCNPKRKEKLIKFYAASQKAQQPKDTKYNELPARWAHQFSMPIRRPELAITEPVPDAPHALHKDNRGTTGQRNQHGHADGQTDKRTGRRADIQTDRQADKPRLKLFN